MANPNSWSLASQAAVSRHLECDRARIVAPFAMLLSAAYGESHRECTSQERVRARHLSTRPARAAPGEAADPGRALPGRRLSPQARHPAAQQPGAGSRPAPRRRAATYSPAVIEALRAIWEAAGFPWSLRLKALLPLWLRWARRRRLRPAVERQLLAISPLQMDRRLGPHRRRLTKRLYGRAPRDKAAPGG